MIQLSGTQTDVETREFHAKLFKVSSGSTFAVITAYVTYMVLGVGDLARAAMAVVILVPCAVSFYLAHRQRTLGSAYVFIIGFFLAYTAAVIKTPTGVGPSSGAFGALMIVAAFALDRRALIALFVASELVVLFIYFVRLPVEAGGGATGAFWQPA